MINFFKTTFLSGQSLFILSSIVTIIAEAVIGKFCEPFAKFLLPEKSKNYRVKAIILVLTLAFICAEIGWFNLIHPPIPNIPGITTKQVKASTPKKITPTPSPVATETPIVSQSGTKPFPTTKPNNNGQNSNSIPTKFIQFTPTQIQKNTPTPLPKATPMPTNSTTENFDGMIGFPYCDLRQSNSSWCTDSTANITLDSGSNGNSSPNSIKFVSTTNDVEMASPLIPVTYGTNYSISSYLNLVSITEGSFSYYIDEYAQNSSWVAGKDVLDVSSPTKQAVFLPIYQPSSSNVVFARLQFIVKGNSGITAYVDSFKWQ